MKIPSFRSAPRTLLAALIMLMCMHTTVRAAELAPEDTPSNVELNESNTPTAEGIRDGTFPAVDVANPTRPSDSSTTAITIATDDNVAITAAASSDIFAAANTITVTEAVDGDIFAGGNTIDITIPDGTVTGSLRLAGNTVTVNATVERNALIFANTVHIGPNAVISGDTHIYANQITVAGTLSGPAVLNGETVRITGTLGGKTTVHASTAAFDDSATVNGATDVTSPNDVVANAAVTGREHITTHKTQARHDMWGDSNAVRIGWWLVSTFFFLLIGSLLILVAPNWFERVVRSMQQQPARTWAKGALALFVTPFVALALCFTLIGIPLAVVLMCAYCFALVVGRLFVGMYIGYELVNEKRFAHKTKRDIMYFVIGYFILSLAMSVPFVGWFVKILAGVWGMGGIIESFKRKAA